MQMIDRLPAVSAAIYNDPITSFELELFRQIANYQPHVCNQFGIFVSNCCNRCDRPLGDDEHMSRGLRRHVVKCQAAIIFVGDLGRNFFIDDSLKDCFFGHGYSP